ncbi:glycosyltransferase family 2 protein [Virgibacillus sp. NKC19-3]|uniref:glycosyltransferase family A protein n=1 Tax=Virgibacillus saliphilus TaxID=2831674 RepID=UPI001C9A8A27|nr:glycosyltransferase family A protein [Virgibacillus sp. NKC19-3]MBY7142191.1 glycosyltransferase family 2 protein [Virgibacillus sp. NKC19-3]
MISVITCTNRNTMMENIFHNYSIQTMRNKELIIVLNKDDMDLNIWRMEAKKYPAVSVYQMPERMLVSDCKNDAVQKARYDHIAKFDDDDYYAPSYLQSAWTIFTKHKEADIVGKSSVYYYFPESKRLCLFPSLTEHTWTDNVADSTLVFKKDIFSHVRFPKQKVGSDKRFQQDCKRNGYHIFATDRYNHAIIRSRYQNHTWKINENQLIKMCSDVVYTDDYPSFVTI